MTEPELEGTVASGSGPEGPYAHDSEYARRGETRYDMDSNQYEPEPGDFDDFFENHQPPLPHHPHHLNDFANSEGPLAIGDHRPLAEGTHIDNPDIDDPDGSNSRPPTPLEMDDNEPAEPGDDELDDPDTIQLRLDMEALGIGPQAYGSDALNPLFSPPTVPPPCPESAMNTETRNGFSSTSKIASTEFFKGAARIYPEMKGSTFTEKFAQDRLTKDRLTSGNIYYPLKSYDEWEFMNVLMRMNCSLEEKTTLLNTQLVRLPPYLSILLG